MPKLRSTAQICPLWEALGSFSCPAHTGCSALPLLRWDAEFLQQLPLAARSSYSKWGHLSWSQAKPAGAEISTKYGGGALIRLLEMLCCFPLLLLHEAAVSSASSGVQTPLSQNCTLVLPWCSWEWLLKFKRRPCEYGWCLVVEMSFSKQQGFFNPNYE